MVRSPVKQSNGHKGYEALPATRCSTDVICWTEKRCFFKARPPGRPAGLCRGTRPQAGPKNPEPSGLLSSEDRQALIA
jgi:hypothetical protein